MELQHTNYHQAYYVNGLIAPVDTYFKAPSTHDQISLQAALKFNGGGKPPPPPPVAFCIYLRLFVVVATGHINHTLFWKGLAPAKEGGGKLMASLRMQLSATLARLKGSRNSSMVRLLGVREGLVLARV